MDDQTAVTKTNAEAIISFEATINNAVLKLEELRQELKDENEMLNSYLNASPEYVEATKTAKDASAKKTNIKNKLIKAPAGIEVANKVTNLKERIKSLQESLTEALTGYVRATGQRHFEGEDGEVREIVYVAKLVKRNQFQK